jgi:hypothetical protein
MLRHLGNPILSEGKFVIDKMHFCTEEGHNRGQKVDFEYHRSYLGREWLFGWAIRFKQSQT